MLLIPRGVAALKISVIIPAYNCAGTVVKTVDSIQKSGLPDCEIIVVDDGSTDGTAERLEALQKKYGNLLVVSQANGGAASARNTGLRHASGDYILFVDADDLIEEGVLTRAAEAVERDNPDMLIYGMTFEHRRFGKCYRKETLVSNREGLFSKSEISAVLPELFRCNYLSPVWNKLIRRDLIEEHGVRFDENMRVMEDCLFSLHCLQYCEKVFLLSDALYRYVVSDDGRKAAERVRRIDSLSKYMEHFSGLPHEYDAVVSEIYRMLLRQQIGSARSVDHLKQIAADASASRYIPAPAEASGAVKLLLEKRFNRILCKNMLSRVRHAAAVARKLLKA